MEIMPYCACVVVVFVLFGMVADGWWLWVTIMPRYVLVQKHHCRHRHFALIEESFLSSAQSENDRDNVNDDVAYHDNFDMIWLREMEKYWIYINGNI